MKRTVPFIGCLILFFMAFTPVAGCKKAEEPKKSEVSVVSPAAPASPGDSIPSSSSATLGVPETPSVPSSTVTSVPPTTPAPAETAVVIPPTSVAPVKPADKDIVLVAGFDSAQMEKSAPKGWLLDRRRGAPFLNLEKGSEGYYLHMRSNNESAFGVKRGIKVDIKEYPYLNWRWRVDRLPDGGDVRKTDTDDQAVQLYVAFTPTGFPAALNTPVLGYIWDNEAPKGWTGRSKQIGGGKLKYVVVRNKTDQLGQWYTEKRNIYEDSKKLLKDSKGGETPGLTHGVQFYINSQNTRSAAESSICEVYFSKN